MQSAQTKLQEQVELSLERIDSIATKLNKPQTSLDFLQTSMSTIIAKLDQLDHRAAESSSSRKHPRPTPTNTEDFVNQNTLNNLSINTTANTNNMDTNDTPQSDAFYNQADDDPNQDNAQRSR
jgi:hypothetical protein